LPSAPTYYVWNVIAIWFGPESIRRAPYVSTKSTGLHTHVEYQRVVDVLLEAAPRAKVRKIPNNYLPKVDTT
jgi:hypothetical protein